MNKYIFSVPVAVLLAAGGCNPPVNPVEKTQVDFARVSEASASCPFLARGVQNELVLSWVQGADDSTYVVCYAVADEHGRKFGDTILIPGTENVLPHAENMPKMIFKPSGEIIAMWGTDSKSSTNKYAGNVFYAQSFDNGKTWTKATPLVRDTAGHDQRYFDLALLGNGEAAVIWLDNRKQSDKEGSSLYFAATTGKDGFRNERAIGTTCCPCCRTDLFVDSKSNVHVAYRKIINDSIRDMVHSVSTDGGASFSEARRISADNWVINGCPHTGPCITESAGGIHFSWYTMGNANGVFYCNSGDNGKTFSERDSVSSKAGAKHPQIASIAGDNIVLVWDEGFEMNGVPKSRIGVQRRTSDGQNLGTAFISEAEGGIEFPVLTVTPSNSVFVAFTMKTENGMRVKYRVIN